MIKFEEHLTSENMFKVILLFPRFGEMKRIIYRSLRSMGEIKPTSARITEKSAMFWQGTQVIRNYDIADLNQLASVSYREAFMQILQYDKVAAQFIKIEFDDETGLVLSIQWQIE